MFVRVALTACLNTVFWQILQINTTTVNSLLTPPGSSNNRKTRRFMVINQWVGKRKRTTKFNWQKLEPQHKTKDIPETQLTSLSKKKNTNVFTRLAFGLCLPLLFSIPSSSASLRLKSLKEKFFFLQVFSSLPSPESIHIMISVFYILNTLLPGSIFCFERKSFGTSIIWTLSYMHFISAELILHWLFPVGCIIVTKCFTNISDNCRCLRSYAPPQQMVFSEPPYRRLRLDLQQLRNIGRKSEKY